MVVDFSAAGLLVDFLDLGQNNHTQTMVGIEATITTSETVESVQKQSAVACDLI